MRFQVPQFIEVQDKIFGPLTLKQFIYLAGGGGMAFVIYVFIGNLILAFIPMALVIGLAVALAFYPTTTFGKPLIDIIEAAFKYYIGSKLFIWRKEDKEVKQTVDADMREAKSYASIMVPKISDSKLKDLTWSLDIKESMYSNRNQK